MTNDWEQRKLGDNVKLITKGTTPMDQSQNSEVNFVKVENLKNGIITPVSKISIDEHLGPLKRSILESQDILISIAGTLGRTAKVENCILPANTNQALCIIRGYNFDSNFLITFLSGRAVKEYIRKNPTVGAQPNLSLNQINNLIIDTPDVCEQAKIGQFFKTLDDTIALHQRKLDTLIAYKTVMLSKMFPKNGASIPEVRIGNFVDEWEQCKLEDYTIYESSKYSSSQFNDLVDTGEFPVYDANKQIASIGNYDQDQQYISIIKDGSGVGRMALRPPKSSVIGTMGYIKNHNSDLYFTYYLMHTLDIKVHVIGSTIPHIYYKDYSKINVCYPTLSEQTKVGQLFKTLDDTIALNKNLIDDVLNVKSSLLSMMFI